MKSKVTTPTVFLELALQVPLGSSSSVILAWGITLLIIAVWVALAISGLHPGKESASLTTAGAWRVLELNFWEL